MIALIKEDGKGGLFVQLRWSDNKGNRHDRQDTLKVPPDQKVDAVMGWMRDKLEAAQRNNELRFN